MNDSLNAELLRLRPSMLRFATLQLRDEAAAEDAVQEAMLSAMTGAAGFEGRAQVKTWVFAILKNKIIDAIRLRARSPVMAFDTEEIAEDVFDELFDARGSWRAEERPASWGDPEQAFSNAQFWRIFDACLTHLPEHTARVFMMREVLGLDSAEICQDVGISSTNYWVIMHRARMGLRLCLQRRWFDNDKRARHADV